MASLTVRNLSDSTKQKLRMRAAAHGRSMEEEARRILDEAVNPPSARRKPTVEDILAYGMDPVEPFDQKAAFDELYEYLDQE